MLSIAKSSGLESNASIIWEVAPGLFLLGRIIHIAAVRVRKDLAGSVDRSRFCRREKRGSARRKDIGAQLLDPLLTSLKTVLGLTFSPDDTILGQCISISSWLGVHVGGVAAVELEGGWGA